MPDYDHFDALEDEVPSNPYQAPSARKQPRFGPGDQGEFGQHFLWSEGRSLVMVKGTPLPDRCIKCNAPAHGYTMKRNLSWHNPAWYLAIFAGLVIYLIAYLAVRQTAVVYIGVCEKHRRQRIRDILLAWLGIAAGIALVVVGANGEAPWGGWVAASGGLFTFISIVYGAVRAQTVSPKKITRELVWLNGISPAYLAAIDQMNEKQGSTKPLFDAREL